MRSRFSATIAFVLSWAYLWVVLVAGCVHHHESAGGQATTHQCAACAWQAKAITDAPIPHPFQVQMACAQRPEAPPFIVSTVSVFHITTARGPPSIFASV